MKLVALKKLRYPRGPDGVEYKEGDFFTAYSERDAKALTLVRAAKNAPDEVVVVRPAAITTAAMSTETFEKPADTPRRRYTRRDVRAED